MRKSHPVRRAVLAGAATVSGIVLLLSLKPASDPGSASAAGGAAPPVAAQSPQGGRGAGTGTVTGDAASTQYGPVQVRLTVSGGKITGAEAVQAPKGGRSDQITADAVPRLNQAAITTGNADIDTVSGATYTSTGYKQSLQSALDKVKAGAEGGPDTRTLTGAVAQTQYGPVQVRVTVSGGKITGAEAVQAPKGGRSDQITADAVPRLNQAAITTGNA
ncbi:FMN-binding protein, partial [Streptomyces sp. NPDC057336]|uniref:FMN-binding protein n=1 Tax=Streptomyces sp. NPDC057336 TaxID=3346102 RepID=UPI00363A80B3